MLQISYFLWNYIYNLFINHNTKNIRNHACNQSNRTSSRDMVMYLTWPTGVHTLDAFDARVSRKGEKKKVSTVWGRRPRVDKASFRIVISHTRCHQDNCCSKKVAWVAMQRHFSWHLSGYCYSEHGIKLSRKLKASILWTVTTNTIYPNVIFTRIYNNIEPASNESY